MASERTRNMIVGSVLIVATGILVVAIFVLGHFTLISQGEPYIVRVNTTNAGGLASGNKVELNGVYVGTIKDVKLADDERSANLILTIEPWAKIPNGSHALVAHPYIGQPSLSINPPDKPQAGYLATDGSAIVPADAADAGLIPRAVTDDLHNLSTKLALVSDDLHDLLQPRATDLVDSTRPGDPNHPLANISTLVQRLDRLSRGIDGMISDPNTQKAIRDILANVQDSTAQLKTVLQSVKGTLANADKTVNQIGGAATQASKTLQSTQDRVVIVSEKLVDTLDSMKLIMNKIADGQGTAGKFVNDPRVYEGLNDVTSSLKATIDQLNLLIRQWKDEGVKLKL
jgi:phospholipid/cholesterol/gamma-HCH transport system substrate-binding protein